MTDCYLLFGIDYFNTCGSWRAGMISLGLMAGSTSRTFSMPGWVSMKTQRLPPSSENAISEDRWATIGLVAWSILYVVYTVREEETIRIISARKAVPHEQKQYRKANP